MHRVSQVLQRRIFVLLTLCLPSFSAPLNCSHRFLGNPCHRAVSTCPLWLYCSFLLSCTLCCHLASYSLSKTSCHPSSSLQCTRIPQLQPFPALMGRVTQRLPPSSEAEMSHRGTCPAGSLECVLLHWAGSACAQDTP